jgi:chromosome partitioning protein
MLTIAVLNRKGGVGKTTIAVNLACELDARGRRVVLVDTDAQGTASDWSAAGDSGVMVVKIDRATLDRDLPKLDGQFDVCVVDGAAKAEMMTVSAVKAADIVVMPISPSAADIWAAAETAEIVKARYELLGRPKGLFVISRAVVGTTLEGEAERALMSFDLPVLEARTHQRVAYVRSLGEGSYASNTSDSKARAEVAALTEEILSHVNPDSHHELGERSEA